MQAARQNLLVGLFVLAGLIFLGTLTILFGNAPPGLMGRRGYPLIIQFKSAAGIREGNQVTVGGIPIGRVQQVDFIDPQRFDVGVNVTVLIDEPYQIPAGSSAITMEPGLGQGRPPIEIRPGPSGAPRLLPRSTIPGEIQSAVAQFLPERVINSLEVTGTRIGEAAKALTPVLEDLHEALMKRAPSEVDRVGGPQGNLSSAMARLDATLKHWNEVLGDPETKSRLKDAIDNVHTITEDGKAISADLKSTAKEFRGVVDDTKAFVAEGRDTVRSIKTEATDLGRVARNMFERGTRLLDSAHDVTSAVSRGEGTLGRLVRDAKLYEAMVLSFERGAKALEDFRLLVQDWLKGKIRVAF